LLERLVKQPLHISTKHQTREGLTLIIKRQKQPCDFGTNVSQCTFKQVDEITGNSKQNVTLPTGTRRQIIQYKISTYSSLNVGYYGNQTQPTIDQLQPIRVNTDPLPTLLLGNPDLNHLSPTQV
jgi:hypothetical protein